MYFSLNELTTSLVLFPGWTGADGVNFEGRCPVHSLRYDRSYECPN